VIQLWSEEADENGDGTEQGREAHNQHIQFSHSTPVADEWSHVAVTRGQPPDDNKQGMDNKVQIFLNGRRELKNLDIGLDQVDIEHILTLGCRTE